VAIARFTIIFLGIRPGICHLIRFHTFLSFLPFYSSTFTFLHILPNSTFAANFFFGYFSPDGANSFILYCFSYFCPCFMSRFMKPGPFEKIKEIAEDGKMVGSPIKNIFFCGYVLFLISSCEIFDLHKLYFLLLEPVSFMV